MLSVDRTLKCMATLNSAVGYLAEGTHQPAHGWCLQLTVKYCRLGAHSIYAFLPYIWDVEPYVLGWQVEMVI